jgi:hypothetical protein
MSNLVKLGSPGKDRPGVSLRPHAMRAPPPDMRGQLQTWENDAAREDRFDIPSFPRRLRRVIEALSERCGRSFTDTVAFLLAEGMTLMEQIDGLKLVETSRQAVRDANSPHITWFDQLGGLPPVAESRAAVVVTQHFQGYRPALWSTRAHARPAGVTRRHPGHRGGRTGIARRSS